MAWAQAVGGKELERISRYRRSHERGFHEALKRLMEIRKFDFRVQMTRDRLGIRDYPAWNASGRQDTPGYRNAWGEADASGTPPIGESHDQTGFEYDTRNETECGDTTAGNVGAIGASGSSPDRERHAPMESVRGAEKRGEIGHMPSGAPLPSFPGSASERQDGKRRMVDG